MKYDVCLRMYKYAVCRGGRRASEFACRAGVDSPGGSFRLQKSPRERPTRFVGFFVCLEAQCPSVVVYVAAPVTDWLQSRKIFTWVNRYPLLQITDIRQRSQIVHGEDVGTMSSWEGVR